MKRLLLTCTDLMAVQFMVPHVKYLSQHGFSIVLACSVVGDRLADLQHALAGTAEIETVRLVRSPFSPENRKGYRDLEKIIGREKWDIIWTNEPVMGVMTRLAARGARSRGAKVLYMTHGYHFFKGCPIKLKFFYPIEKQMSRYCDGIITINQEDYELTKAKFHAARVYHVHGIGLDTEKFSAPCHAAKKRAELGIPQSAFVVMSVGELKPHKNHKVILDALAELRDPDIHYLLCGKGELLNMLQQRARDSGIENQVHFLGYRTDVQEILGCADVFAFPSIREGLGLASLEAMSAGLPVLGADTRGIRDYVINGKTGYLCDPGNAAEFAAGIQRLRKEQLRKELGRHCRAEAAKYDIRHIEKDICSILEETL